MANLNFAQNNSKTMPCWEVDLWPVGRSMIKLSVWIRPTGTLTSADSITRPGREPGNMRTCFVPIISPEAAEALTRISCRASPPVHGVGEKNLALLASNFLRSVWPFYVWIWNIRTAHSISRCIFRLSIIRPPRYEWVYLPLCKVADTPFYI